MNDKQNESGGVKIEEAREVTIESKSSQSLGVPGAIVLGSALIAAAIYFGFANLAGGGFLPNLGGDTTGNETTGTTPPPAAPTSPVDVTVGDLPVIGDASAPVVIVEWADFQCPFCGRWHKDVRPGLQEYLDNGQVQFAYRDFAFLGQESNDSANAARCANEQGKFWQYHDLLFENQNGENRGAFSKENLKGFGRQITGLNLNQFNGCVDSDKYADAVEADTAAGRAAGVNGTPTTFVNGQVVNGAQPFSAFKTIIDAELTK